MPRTHARGGPNDNITRKVVAIALIVVLATVVVIAFYPPVRQTISPYVGGPSLTLSVGRPNVLHEPNGTIFVVLTASAKGGSFPYSFTCNWADGVRQTSTTGIFQRSFQPGQTVPTSADITAKSADGLTGSAKVTIGS